MRARSCQLKHPWFILILYYKMRQLFHYKSFLLKYVTVLLQSATAILKCVYIYIYTIYYGAGKIKLNYHMLL